MKVYCNDCKYICRENNYDPLCNKNFKITEIEGPITKCKLKDKDLCEVKNRSNTCSDYKISFIARIKACLKIR